MNTLFTDTVMVDAVEQSAACFPARKLQLGFSLIELMISVTIGLLGVLVIFQVMSVWNERKRTTSSGSDAQVAGTIGMFSLERELKVAGYGLGRMQDIEWGCTVNMRDSTGTNVTFPLLPLLVTQGLSSAPDTITAIAGSSSYFTGREEFTQSAASSKRTRQRVGLFPGDILVVTNRPTSAACEVIEVTALSAGEARTIEHQNVSYEKFGAPVGVLTASRFNPPGGADPAFVSGSIYNLGPTPRRTVWQIRAGGVLTSTETFGGLPAIDVADGIVDLQAEYGSMDGSTGVGGIITWAEAAPTPWTNLWAVRVAVLSRSQQFERLPVTTAAITYFGGTKTFAMNNVFGAAASDAANSPTNWRHYRYRVYEQVVPIRNMMWGRRSRS